MGRLIFTREEAAKLTRQDEAILALAEKHDAYGAALAHIGNGKSLAEFKQYLANDRAIEHATRAPQRWSSPY
ncbi:MAG TPA: hypothetical protein VK673_21340 [Chthoniobacterales bacterium]|nr:hypothetical protein [Chthoniobacterales bacterium]